MADLNQISKVVLSTLNINKLIDILVDEVFCNDRDQETFYLSMGGRKLN